MKSKSISALLLLGVACRQSTRRLSGRRRESDMSADDADSQPRPDQCGQIVKGRKHQRGTKKHQKKHIMFLGTKTLALPCIFIAFSISIFNKFQFLHWNPATQAEKKVYGKDFLEFFLWAWG